MRRSRPVDTFETFLWGQIVLVALLASALALFLLTPTLRVPHDLASLRLVLSTVYALCAGLVALLAATRFGLEGRKFDLFLCAGFAVLAASWTLFSVGPAILERSATSAASWAEIAGSLLGWTIIAAAPFVHGAVERRAATLRAALSAGAALVLGLWLLVVEADPTAPTHNPALRTTSFALFALVNLVAVVGFGDRVRVRREDLDQWLALGATLTLFASLHFVFSPAAGTNAVTQGDFLRLLGYAVLLVGVWRAMRASEHGRAVAEERARVAREIHDGLSQYLFAVATPASMIDAGVAPPGATGRLKEAALAAQAEARFAILALSSASGSAPFDTALRRYVDFVASDGGLEVDLVLEPGVRLAPDEQIEVFRIVQEGLANAHRHAGARRAEVRIGRRDGGRAVTIVDDGTGFDPGPGRDGQGLGNMRRRASAIGGAFSLTAAPNGGTALEVVLRA